MNGLATMGTLAGFRGGDVARNCFEEKDGGFAEMRNELRGRDRFAFALGVGASHKVRGYDELERFGANARAIRDDEIAKAEKRFVFLPHGNVEEGVRPDHEKDAVALTGMAEVADGV